jgi:hypothetical protein
MRNCIIFTGHNLENVEGGAKSMIFIRVRKRKKCMGE